MSTDIIRENILLDTTSSTASFIYNLDPTAFPNGPNSVPRFLYTCLADLCSGIPGTFSDIVIADYGLADTKSTLGIILQPDEIRPSSLFANSDTLGAECTYLSILVRNVKTARDFNLMRDIGLRLIYILDFRSRNSPYNQYLDVNNLSPDLSVGNSYDYTVSPNFYYKAKWEGSTVPHAIEQTHRFSLEYVRVFPDLFS